MGYRITEILSEKMPDVKGKFDRFENRSDPKQNLKSEENCAGVE